jgi:hypothetical protein
VKKLGRRNAKPTAYREVVDEYVQHQQRTPPIENEAGGWCGCRRRKTEMEMQRKQRANVRAD